MSKKPLIHIIAGARPNFMKISPVVEALRSRAKEKGNESCPGIRIIHTGQHYDPNMSDVFFNDLGIPQPDYFLEIGSGSQADQTARTMVAYEKVLLQDCPDLVIVVGDVNSTLACSLTGKKMGIRVAHVEAGLRSFDMTMPEEINRKLTDAISDLLFVTEEAGIRNLRKEGVPEEKIFFVGNVMIDTLRKNLLKLENGDFSPAGPLKSFLLGKEQYAVLTLHRPSNVDRKEDLCRVWSAIQGVAAEVPVLFPVHPRTRNRIEEHDPDVSNICMVAPLGYLDMLYAVKGSTLVLTDSGGLQEETTALGIPCVTIRENTERPSTVDIGTNYLAGTDPGSILAAAREILSGHPKKGGIPPHWDGHAAERIADIVLREMKKGGGIQ
jgi:UDP-N-acetylglucosamine 2-epimerase (non-hydrolysing)